MEEVGKERGWKSVAKWLWVRNRARRMQAARLTTAGEAAHEPLPALVDVHGPAF